MKMLESLVLYELKMGASHSVLTHIMTPTQSPILTSAPADIKICTIGKLGAKQVTAASNGVHLCNPCVINKQVKYSSLAISFLCLLKTSY